ncbi:GntR family transcriptional regulator [Actinomadura macra]|uniref:GntR family transcriptional regulator n=1 Tax=Actinomadura macra TaxID=46164 RepID=UPI000831303D|nr:GntR family transcriptional regulator [Actinomadura macra]
MTAADRDVLDQLPPLSQAADHRLPLWVQVADSVRDFAERSTAGAPVRLPTEVQLARHYAVSVSTVRQALTALESEGLLTRRRRHGTFLAARDVQARPLHLTGSLDAVVHQQASDETTVLDKTMVPVPEGLRDAFPGAAEVVEFQRVRYADGAVLNYAKNYLRRDVGARIDRESLRRGSMTQLLRDELGLELGRIDNEIAAISADSQIARLLDVEPHAPVLLSRNLTFDTGGDVVDAALIYYRADRFRFAFSLALSPQAQT